MNVYQSEYSRPAIIPVDLSLAKEPAENILNVSLVATIRLSATSFQTAFFLKVC